MSQRQRLHVPGIYRLFFDSVVDARCNRACLYSREYHGLSRETQGQWSEPFFFVHIGDPQFGMSAGKLEESTEGGEADKNSGGMDWVVEEERLRKAITAINRIRPR